MQEANSVNSLNSHKHDRGLIEQESDADGLQGRGCSSEAAKAS